MDIVSNIEDYREGGDAPDDGVDRHDSPIPENEGDFYELGTLAREVTVTNDSEGGEDSKRVYVSTLDRLAAQARQREKEQVKRRQFLANPMGR